MGQKVNPIGFRTGITEDWTSKWYAPKAAYGAFLIDQLGIASPEERMQALESVLEMPRPLLKFVRVPFELPVGPLQTEKLDPELIAKGLITAKPPKAEGEEEEEEEWVPWDERPPLLAEK